MSDGYVQKKLASLRTEGATSPQVERKRDLNDANKKARARFYAAEILLDKLQRECTAACADSPPETWGDALDKYDAELATFLKAADELPPGARA